ncbi:MAG: hypothetical protein M1834_005154 [Cirrosporium novae-zelandiae]|nr:MAG: hypothetical protein M1834_005154 [Cirrosporium novae-zelandiae]
MVGYQHQNFNDDINLTGNPRDGYDYPPPYESTRGAPTSKWNPKTWNKKMLLLSIGAVVAIIVIAVAVAVVEVRKNRYPNYSKLSYSIEETYSGTGFFDKFEYFTGYDPTSGFVHYDNPTDAANRNVTYATSSSAILRVDNSSDDSSTGRHSARIHSKKQYDSGLFIFDVAHTPYGCATWPALWLSDTIHWPTNGEIDVVEAVNLGNTGSHMTLHTTDNCDMDVKRKETGTILETDCYNATNDNDGCGVLGAKSTFGAAFNENGGGVYAMEWRAAGIRVWVFQRDEIPDDITAGSSPDPSGWGTATADFPNTDCSISSHFKNQSIIANIDLCGTWAGSTSVYAESGCPSTCEDLVADNATNFDTAYWEFNSFKVYTAS